MTATHFSAAAGIGFEQASRIGNWSLRAGLALLEEACELATALFGEIVVAKQDMRCLATMHYALCHGNRHF